MSETKIQLPEGMLKAIGTAPNVCHCSTCESGNEERLKSALRWLSENPIVPSEADVMEILQERVESHHISGKEYCAIPPATVRFVIRESQRRMFLAPDGPDVSQWTCQLSGYTFTQEEADAICEYVRTASHPIRAGFNGEPVASNVEFTNALKAVQGEAPEPEVPSGIRDIDAWLTVYLGSHPEIENIRRNFLLTFRRGQQSK